MNQLNSILIEGNLTRDPEVKELPNGTTLCTFLIASNRFLKKGEDFEKETSFFEIDTWGALAQSCAKVLRKGRGIRVVGRLKQDRWVDGNGKSQSRVKIIAEHVEFKPDVKKGESEEKGESDV